MNRVTDPASFVRWFRDCSPYIKAHRGRTFVLYFGGEAVADPAFSHLIHDITLLNSLGVRLVVVHGAQPQAEARLRAAGASPRQAHGRPIIDETELRCWSEAAAETRLAIEAKLTMGLINSPMDGAGIRVVTSNAVLARPVGVHDGVDFCYTGEVRKVDASGLRAALDAELLVLLGPLGFSPTGEVFVLDAEEVAINVATALPARKLLYLGEQPGPTDARGKIIRQLSAADTAKLLQQRDDLSPATARRLRHALRACEAGVRRTHLLDRTTEGALLQELFTRDGVGTLVSAQAYEGLRPARIEDIGGILQLIAPLEQQGVLVRRSRELLETEIGHFVVQERDGGILACAALYPFAEQSLAELACVATHPDYRGEGRAAALLAYLEEHALESDITKLFVLTTQAAHWFRERGFEPADVSELPPERQRFYNWQRNSRVFIKTLT